MPQSGQVAFAMPQTIATSDFRCSLGGVTRPDDACTIDMLSSTVIDCRPPACMSISLRARHGRISACSPWTRWPRLSLVLIADGQPQAAHRRLGDRSSPAPLDEIAAEPDENLGAPVDHRLTASTTWCP